MEKQVAHLISIFLMLLSAGFFHVATAQDESNDKTGILYVTVNSDEVIYPIHPLFWGTNLLYWIDDDAALANGKIASALKAVNMKLLRYPGGTVADNFHWQTNTLENESMYPYEGGIAETDFDEFMMLCRKTGAAPACVLNTETWAVKNDIAGGAHEAANWLRYTKTKGYDVKYWEIGNETYWHPVMSAEEYADLVNVYADSLKRIDPDIILGVNGHWDINFVGTKERIRPDSYEQLMDYRRNITNRDAYQRYKNFTIENTILPVTTGAVKWWETVASRCGSNVDMIVVHWYFGPRQLPEITTRLLEVREVFSRMFPEKKYLLNMSEYNTLQRNPEAHMHLTEMVGAMLEARTDITGFWPMRLKYKKPTLLQFETNDYSILFHIHKQLSEQLTGSVVATSASAAVPSFASVGNKKTTVVMTGSKIDKTTRVRVKVNGGKRAPRLCSVWSIHGEEEFSYTIKEIKVRVENGMALMDLAPGEVVIATFK